MDLASSQKCHWRGRGHLPSLACDAGNSKAALSVSLLTQGLVSCLLGEVPDSLSSSGLALSSVEGLCMWRRGDVEQRFIIGSCSLFPCSFFWVHFKVCSEDL